MKKKLTKIVRGTKSPKRAHPEKSARGSAARSGPKKAVAATTRARAASSKAVRKPAAKKKAVSRKKAPPSPASPAATARTRTPARSPARGAPKSFRGRPDDADAFLRVKGRDPSSAKDDFAEELAEDFVGAATSGEEQALETRDTVLDEEAGGPFVTTPAKREFADGLDASNPEDAEREPFPSVTSQPDS